MWLHEWDIWNPIVWNEKETNFLLVCLGFTQVSSHMCTQLIPCLYVYAYIVQLLTCASITAYDAANAQFYFHFLPVIFSVEKFTGFISNAYSVCYMYDTKVKLISLSFNLPLQEMFRHQLRYHWDVCLMKLNLEIIMLLKTWRRYLF